MIIHVGKIVLVAMRKTKAIVGNMVSSLSNHAFAFLSKIAPAYVSSATRYGVKIYFYNPDGVYCDESACSNRETVFNMLSMLDTFSPSLFHEHQKRGLRWLLLVNSGKSMCSYTGSLFIYSNPRISSQRTASISMARDFLWKYHLYMMYYDNFLCTEECRAMATKEINRFSIWCRDEIKKGQ